MATKAQLEAKINEIADGEENTAEEVREFANGLLNELFKTPIYDNEVNETITSRLNTGITYGINFTKCGNQVTLNGEIKTSAFLFSETTDLIAFTDLEYEPTNNLIQRFKQDGFLFRINNGKITSVSPLTSNKTIYLNLTYVTD